MYDFPSCSFKNTSKSIYQQSYRHKSMEEICYLKRTDEKMEMFVAGGRSLTLKFPFDIKYQICGDY